MAEQRTWGLRALHLTSAMLLGLFLVLHLTNHVAGLFGQEQHMSFMQLVRPLYRNVVVEPVLLMLLAWQLGSGAFMVVRGWRSRRGKVAWLQAGSGLYLAAFIIIHTLSVLAGRAKLGLDTDFRFAAAGFHAPAWPWYFWPYYSIAIFALFAHVGCAIYWNTLNRSQRVATTSLSVISTLGMIFGLLIAASLAGILYPVAIPTSYSATYRIN